MANAAAGSFPRAASAVRAKRILVVQRQRCRQTPLNQARHRTCLLALVLRPVAYGARPVRQACGLTQRLGAFHILVDNVSTVDGLLAADVTPSKGWSVFLMVDCGYHRDGVDPSAPVSVTIAKKLHV